MPQAPCREHKGLSLNTAQGFFFFSLLFYIFGFHIILCDFCVCLGEKKEESFLSLKGGLDFSLYFTDQEIFCIFPMTGISGKDFVTPLTHMNSRAL